MSRARRKPRQRPSATAQSRTEAKSEKHQSRRRPWRLVILLVGGSLLVGAAVYYRTTTMSNPLLRMPMIEPEGLLPTVAQALHEAQAAITAAPESAEAWGTYGLVLLAHGFRREAIVSFQEAERLDPKDYRWSYYLGMTEGMFDAKKAAAAFERAVKKAPQRTSVRLRLAEWYFDLRQLDASQQQTEVALKQEPNNARAQLMMARLAFERGRIQESLQWALKAEQSPQGNRRDVHELLARVYQRLGKRAAALREVDLAEKLPRGVAVWDDPEMGIGATYLQDASVLNALAAASQARGDIDRAIQLLYRVVQFDPRNVMWKENLIRTLIQCRRYDEALQVLPKALQQHPSSAELMCLQGEALLAVGRARQAQTSFEKALREKPDFAEALDFLGRALLAQGQTGPALQAWQRAVTLRPDDIDLRLRIAEVLRKQGDNAAAQRQLTAAKASAKTPDQLKRVTELLQQVQTHQTKPKQAQKE